MIFSSPRSCYAFQFLIYGLVQYASWTTVNVDGKTCNAIFTVEAKDGKITIPVGIEMMEGRKFLYIETYEEVK